MKDLFTFSSLSKKFFALVALLLFVGVGNVWGGTTGTINFGSSQGYTKINATDVNGNDSQGNTWYITTVGTSSFTSNSYYYQVGSNGSPATSITFTMTLGSSQAIGAFSAKFGGNSDTAGTVTLKVGNTVIGTGYLSGSSDVIISNSIYAAGTELTVTVTSIDKGVKCYYISYTYVSTMYTVSWYHNGSSYTTTGVPDGYKPYFPSNPSSCDVTSDTFYGWSTAEWDGTVDGLAGKTVYASASAMPAVTAAGVTYYSVFAKKTVGDLASVTGGSCTTTYPPQASSGYWTGSGTGTGYGTNHGVKFDGVNDYIMSEDISSNGYTDATVKIKAGYNGSSGSVFTIYSLDDSGNEIDSKTITPTDTYTSQTTTYSVSLTGNKVIKNIKVALTYRTSNMGMEYCEVFHAPVTWSKYRTNCCTALGAINGSVSLSTKTAYTITATWPKTSGDKETGYSVQLYDNNGTGVKGSKIGDPVPITGKADGDRTCTFGAKTPVGSRLTANHEYFVGVTPTYSGDGGYCETGTEVTASTTTNQVYTVTYAGGSGSEGTMTDSNSPYEAGDEVTVLTNTFTKCGYTFDAWSYSPAQTVSDGKFTMGTANVTITATWTSLQDEFLDYMHENSRTTRSGKYTAPPALSDETPGDGCEGEHYKFMGWVNKTSINEDGTLKSGYVLVSGGATNQCATGATFQAVWATEE